MVRKTMDRKKKSGYKTYGREYKSKEKGEKHRYIKVHQKWKQQGTKEKLPLGVERASS